MNNIKDYTIVRKDNFHIRRGNMENFQKLDYILDTHMNATEVTRAFGFKSETMISKLRKGKSHISTLYLDGLEKYFNIPSEIFIMTINDTDEIDELIKSYQLKKSKEKGKKEFQQKILKKLEETHLIPKEIFNKDFFNKGELNSFIKKHKEQLLMESTDIVVSAFSNQVFPKNEKLFHKLKGVWYGYVYPSNPASAEHGIWEVKTTIHDNYSVIDYWGNKGYLKIGKNESLIIKESYDYEDLTIIRFSNRQVSSGIFRFVIVSNQNHTLHEMVNFGFFSRQRYDLEEAKEILGSMESKQLKLDINFNERLLQKAIVPQ